MSFLSIHDHTMSLRGKVWIHQANLTPPRLLEVSVPSHEGGRPWDFDFISMVFQLDF